MAVYLDPLGFSRQTETILRGLGATDLIAECERRNISTQTLHELNEDDFVKLGASPTRAAEIKAALAVSSTKEKFKNQMTDKLEERLSQFDEIITRANEQLQLMEAHLAYTGLRLLEEQIDDFVEPNTPYTASQALVDGVSASLTELNELEQEIFGLEHQLNKSKPKESHPIPNRTSDRFPGLRLLITFGLIYMGVRYFRK